MRLRQQLARLVHPGQALLRATVLLGAAVAVTGAALVDSVPTWGAVAVGLTALLSVARPDSWAGLGVVALVGQLWLALPEDSVASPWLLLSAAGLVVFHAGLVIAAQGPARMRPDPVQIRRWTVRGLGLWVTAFAVWVAAGWLQGTPAPSTVLVAVLVLLLAATVWSASRLTSGSPTP